MMALIEESKGRKTGSGYQRVFGSQPLGHLLSRVQSCVIRDGNELEKLIISKADSIDVATLLAYDPTLCGTFLVDKQAIKRSVLKSTAEPDFLIFELYPQKKQCAIVELKDGNNFDTKKAAGEVASLKNFQADVSSKIPYTTTIHVCSFNQEDKEKIVEGFKHKITPEMAMTGRELCTKLSLDYDAIVSKRKQAQAMNMAFFVDALLNVDEVRDKIQASLNTL